MFHAVSFTNENTNKLLFQSRNDTDIFGAYYDESRIAREPDQDFVWNVLARESIASYNQITEQSGKY